MRIELDERRLRELGVRLLVAFGSRVEGRPRRESDLDLGVAFESERRPAGLRFFDVLQAVRASGVEVDLADLDAADPLLLYEVATRGRPLFEAREGTWEEFRIRGVKRYLDTAWLRKREAEFLRKRFA